MLRSKTLSSVLWSVTTTWGEQIIMFVLLVILARLLDPSEFGLVALAGLGVYVLQDIIRVTVNRTLIQMEDADETHFSTVFWIIISFALIVTLALVMAADAIAAFFGEPDLAPIIPVLSVVLLINSCEIVQELKLVRAQTFRPLAVRSFSAAFIGGAVSITMAFNGYGVWSIVVQQVVSAIVMLIVTTYFARWVPRLVISLSHLRDVARFGRYITGMAIVEHLYSRLDILIIGSFLGSQAVGLYNAGFRLLKMLLNGVAGALVRALMPALSRMQTEPERFREAFLRCLRLTTTLTMPIFVGLACVSHEAVFVILGSKWADAVPIVALLGMAGAMQSFGLLCATTLTAYGRVQPLFYLSLAYGVVYGLAMLAGVQWGVIGVATAFLVTIYVMDLAQGYLLCRLLNIPVPLLLRNVAPMMVATACMATAILSVKQAIILSSYIALPVYVTLGVLTYGTIIALIAPALRADIFGLFGEMFRRRVPVSD